MIIKSICIIVLFIISFIISLPFFFNYLNLNLLNFINHYFIDLFYYNAFKFISRKKKLDSTNISRNQHHCQYFYIYLTLYNLNLSVINRYKKEEKAEHFVQDVFYNTCSHLS